MLLAANEPTSFDPNETTFNCSRGFLSCFFVRQTVRRAVRVALVVGPILGLINHFDLCLGAEITTVRLAKISLTFLVPFCVSGYSSTTTMMAGSAEETQDR